MPSRGEAFDRFVYEVGKDFKGPDGQSPEWATKYPKEWGQEDESITLPLQNPDKTGWDLLLAQYQVAVSDDQRLLVVSDEKGALIFHIPSRALRQRIRQGEEEVDHVHLITVPKDDNASDQERRAGPGYILLCGRRNRSGKNGTIEFYDLGHNGKLLDEDEPLDSKALSSKAVAGIRDDLVKKYEWTDEDIKNLDLAGEFQKILELADTKRSTQHQVVLDGALAGFGSHPFNSERRKMLYIIKNDTTQSGQRPPEDLPHIVVYDILKEKELIRLAGHTDAIMWAGYSPDDQYIASVSWDGSLRVYRASDGELAWTAKGDGHQSWSGTFSPDSRYILWSSAGGTSLAVHDLSDGTEVAVIDELDIKRWVRNIVWHPSDSGLVAFTSGTSLYLWRPFEKAGERVVQEFSLKPHDNSIRGFMTLDVSWLDGGRKVLVSCSDGTIEIWDMEKNVKWRMLKPQGKHVGVTQKKKKLLLEGKDGEGPAFVSVDGDGTVRFWKL